MIGQCDGWVDYASPPNAGGGRLCVKNGVSLLVPLAQLEADTRKRIRPEENEGFALFLNNSDS